MKLVSTEHHGENSLCTYLECACAVAKGGVAVLLRYSECKCQKAKRQKQLYKFNEACYIRKTRKLLNLDLTHLLPNKYE